ncbi:MAG: hypothetical protein K5662_05310 [Lachnospiraceae bacterium]|nr:hypothetical protein [Lachnospiraceae bacterium]
MDKGEYKIKSEEIKTLIKEKEFQKAVEIADTIDWTRVRSVTTLCTISDLYKINRRYNEAMILLEQAYSKHPAGKQIVYSLCELYIKMNDIVNATEYYKKYIQLAPTDNNKFILLYKIYELQDVSLEERIEVLEEYKKRDYREKWGYELAYLYHRIGLATKCVEECDELIVWFREGKYVKKAMELKMLHQQLTQTQEILYQSMLQPQELKAYTAQITPIESPSEEKPSDTDMIQVKTMDLGKYSTINIQQALAESMKDVMVEEDNFDALLAEDDDKEETSEVKTNPQMAVANEIPDENAVPRPGSITESIMAPMLDDLYEVKSGTYSDLQDDRGTDEGADEEEITDNTVFYPAFTDEELKAAAGNVGIIENYSLDDTGVDNGRYASGEINFDRNNTSSLAGSDTAELEEVILDEPEEVDDNTVYLPFVDTDEIPQTPVRAATIPNEDVEPDGRMAGTPSTSEISREYTTEREPYQADRSASEEVQANVREVIMPDSYDTVRTPVHTQPVAETPDLSHIPVIPASGDTIVYTPHGRTHYSEPNIDMMHASKEELMELINQKVAEAIENALRGKSLVDHEVEVPVRSENPPQSMRSVLKEEYDGQIGMVLPEQEVVEKQITGQINIEEFLEDWENSKRQSQERNQEAIKQRVLEQTGTLFTDFDLKAKDGMLERLEQEAANPVVEDDDDEKFNEFINEILAKEEGSDKPVSPVSPVKTASTGVSEVLSATAGVATSGSAEMSVEGESISKEKAIAEAISEDNEVTEAPAEEDVTTAAVSEDNEVTEAPAEEGITTEAASEDNEVTEAPAEEDVTTEAASGDNEATEAPAEEDVTTEIISEDREAEAIYSQESVNSEESVSSDNNKEIEADSDAGSDESAATADGISEGAETSVEEGVTSNPETASEDDNDTTPEELSKTSQIVYSIPVNPEIPSIDELESEIAANAAMAETQEGTEDSPSASADDTSLAGDTEITGEAAQAGDGGVSDDSAKKAEESDTSNNSEAGSDSESEDESKLMHSLSDEEISLFTPFVQTKNAKLELVRQLDNISLASYTGNAFVSGESFDESIDLAKNVMRYAQGADSNFSGKIAKVSGVSLNDKPIDMMLEKLSNGGLIVERASGMDENTVNNMLKVLNQGKIGIMVILQDNARAIQKIKSQYDGIDKIFNVHIQVEELSDDALVAYGRKYAERKEYAIDEMGVLALHTRIAALQTSDHVATVADVREIVDEAIKRATKKSVRHFSDILLGNRYNEEDMIILKEKDFDIY